MNAKKQSISLIPMAMAQLAILANANSGIEEASDLNQAGKKVAVETGSTGDVWAASGSAQCSISFAWQMRARV